ncbi:MAG: DeoR family transcriptional regulator [Phyllobacteriaceae bacterium]|nr:DeoR family transcriptional regulator [Phyllobacteriaceae bacterium]MBA91216.1 DeoR family transcriptional regulator [Phyllobacteriaceae bacterium]
MSFEKARQLIELATMAAARHGGISLDEIAKAFECSHRTAQRMTNALERCFQDVEVHEDEERRRRWRIVGRRFDRLALREEEALEALDIAAREAAENGRNNHAAVLHRLRNRFLATLPRPAALRAETDAEALLSSLGVVRRPGPYAPARPEITETLYRALRGPFHLSIRYNDHSEEPRKVAPLGFLQGPRSYLVALKDENDPGSIRHFRVDRIREAECLETSFAIPADFDLPSHAQKAFGAWHDSSQYGEVVWKFSPTAAPAAMEFRFHPDQQTERQPDGSLIVRFKASGWLEMAWHLYQWGDHVEVLAPHQLRDLVHPHRRRDFWALP